MSMRAIRQCGIGALASLVALHFMYGIGGASEYAPQHILVKYSAVFTQFQRLLYVSQHNGAAPQRYFDLINWELVLLPDTAVVAAIADFKSDTEHFADAQPNWYHTSGLLSAPNDPEFPKQWHLHNTGQNGCTVGADIDAVAGWQFVSEAPNVVIAMLDDGWDYSHPDFDGNAWNNPGEDPANCIDDDANGRRDDFRGSSLFMGYKQEPWQFRYTHGTSVAGIVAARGNNGTGVSGVAWRAKLMDVQFIHEDYPNFTSATVVEAILYAVNEQADVINASWTHGQDHEVIIYEAIEAACDAGLLFVAAAGNAGDNNDVAPWYPASYDCPCIVSVAMTDCHDELVGEANQCDNGSKSNYGYYSVDLAAPGQTWTTTFDRSQVPPVYEYAFGCGTSASAPQVSGAAALVWAQNPTWSALQVKYRLLMTVDQLPSLVGKTFSGGRLNLRKALDHVPPDAVSDLTVEMGRTTAVLRWTAPGDNGTEGTAWQYDLRFSTAPIYGGNFEDATPIPTAEPSLPGSAECEELGSMTRCQNYYFALRTRDEAGNWSGLSNLPVGYRCDEGMEEASCGDL